MSSNRSTFYAVTTRSADETERQGRQLGEKIRSGLCVCLIGSLGAGKTVFTRGLCRGLGVLEEVISPTFILYEQFEGRLKVIHIDLYRLEHESELEELGVFDQLRPDTVVVAEWGDRSDSLMAAADLVVTIRAPEEKIRILEFNGTGQVAGEWGEP